MGTFTTWAMGKEKSGRVEPERWKIKFHGFFDDSVESRAKIGS